MICHKCGFDNNNDDECFSCGIFIKKYINNQKLKIYNNAITLYEKKLFEKSRLLFTLIINDNYDYSNEILSKSYMYLEKINEKLLSSNNNDNDNEQNIIEILKYLFFKNKHYAVIILLPIFLFIFTIYKFQNKQTEDNVSKIDKINTVEHVSDVNNVVTNKSVVNDKVPEKHVYSEQEITSKFMEKINSSKENLNSYLLNKASSRTIMPTDRGYLFDFYFADEFKYDVRNNNSTISKFNAILTVSIPHILISTNDNSMAKDCVNSMEIIPNCMLVRMAKNNVNSGLYNAWQDGSVTMQIEFLFNDETGWKVSNADGVVFNLSGGNRQIAVGNEYYSREYYNEIVKPF